MGQWTSKILKIFHCPFFNYYYFSKVQTEIYRFCSVSDYFKKRKAWWTVTMTPLRILVGINSEYQKSCQWHLVYFCKCECCTLYAVWVSVHRDLVHCSAHNRYLIELLSTQRTQYTSRSTALKIIFIPKMMIENNLITCKKKKKIWVIWLHNYKVKHYIKWIILYLFDWFLP